MVLLDIDPAGLVCSLPVKPAVNVNLDRALVNLLLFSQKKWLAYAVR